MTEWRYFVEKDLKRLLVNTGVLAGGFLFYLKFGFYGWEHLLTVLCLQYAVFPLDDWLEGQRPFPYHAAALMIIGLCISPFITLSVIAGTLLVNIRVLLKRNTFLLERIEAIGNLFVYILPFILPLQHPLPRVYLAAILFVLFADSFHKIGHRETLHPKAMWATGLLFLGLLAFLFSTATVIFAVLAVMILASLIPFAVLKDEKQAWVYTQVWFGFAGPVAYYYYFFVFLP